MTQFRHAATRLAAISVALLVLAIWGLAEDSRQRWERADPAGETLAGEIGLYKSIRRAQP